MGSPNSSLSAVDYIIGQKTADQLDIKITNEVLIAILRAFIEEIKPSIKHLGTVRLGRVIGQLSSLGQSPGGYSTNKLVLQIPGPASYGYRFITEGQKWEPFYLVLTEDGKILKLSYEKGGEGLVVEIKEQDNTDLAEIEKDLPHPTTLIFLVRQLLISQNRRLEGYLTTTKKNILWADEAARRMNIEFSKHIVH